jgi:formylglycine-generating enzyme required for sulfatase activity
MPVRLAQAGPGAASPGSPFIQGDFWALVIGINEYPSLPPSKQLLTGTASAQRIVRILRGQYGFAREAIKDLYDRQATRSGILRTLRSYTKEVQPNDSLFIYYAGHCLVEEASKETWWLPADAQEDDVTSYISLKDLQTLLAQIPARHIFLVADSCFDETLLGANRIAGTPTVREAYQKKSRWLLASGVMAPAPEGGPGRPGPSPFTSAFLQMLGNNQEAYLTPIHIAVALTKRLPEAARRGMKYQPLAGVEDDGGQFVFRLEGAAPPATLAKIPSLEDPRIVALREQLAATQALSLPQAIKDQAIAALRTQIQGIEKEIAEKQAEAKRRDEEQRLAALQRQQQEEAQQRSRQATEVAARQAALRRQEEEKRLAELKRQEEEAAKRIAALQKQAEEQARQAERRRQEEEQARQAELKRQEEEAAKRIAALQKQAEEQARQAERRRQEEERRLAALRQQQGAAQQGEAQKQAEEAARQAELKRQEEEQARQAELKRQEEVAANRIAALQKQAEEQARQAEQKRQQEEQARQAELKRQEEEAAKRIAALQKQVEEQARQAERRRQEEERRLASERERLAALQKQAEEQARQAELRRQEEERRLAALRTQQEAALVARVSPPAAKPPTVVGPKPEDLTPMVLIPAGEFIMGSDPREGNADETPQRKVFLEAFHIDKFETTVDRYARYLAATGVEPPEYWNRADPVADKDLPVIGVDWDQAQGYCKWAGKRLPSEAEWEKAARGTDGRIHPWGNEGATQQFANYGRGGSFRYGKSLENVGSYESGKSPYGIYDLVGNVWEWVADWYDKDYYENAPIKNPKGPEKGQYRVIRGGSWSKAPLVVRAAGRNRAAPTSQTTSIGFRCAKDGQ